MGYFSNGTEGDMYVERWCSRCVHSQAADGCAVWEVHLLHNYDAHSGHVAEILNALIPRTPNGLGNGRCRMFTPLSDS